MVKLLAALALVSSLAFADIVNAGIEEARQKNWPRAVELLQRAVSESPSNASAWYWLGASQFYTRKFEAARESFEQARALRPSDSFTYRMLGLVFMQLKRPNDAYQNWLTALELNPRDARLVITSPGCSMKTRPTIVRSAGSAKPWS